METYGKSQFEEVIIELNETIEQLNCSRELNLCPSCYLSMFDVLTSERPMMKCGVVSGIIQDLRNTMGDDVVKRTEIIFSFLGSDLEQQEKNFLSLPWYQRWLLKAYLYSSACLEYIAFGLNNLYRKVRLWIQETNEHTGYDVFSLPDEMPSLDEAAKYLEEKVDLEEKLIGLIK